MHTRILVLNKNKMTSIYEVIKERECDPHPGKYSLWCTGNGSIHRKFRSYNSKGELPMDIGKSDKFKRIKLLNFDE